MNIKNIKSVGVELEGGMCDYSLNMLMSKLTEEFKEIKSRLEVGADRSVDVDIYCDDDDVHRHLELRIWVEVEEIEKLLKFIKLLWRHGFEQNETCGNHMHLGFKNKFYISVFTVYDAVRDYLTVYHKKFRDRRKYMRRLMSRYSKAIESEEDIAINLTDDRYYAINLLSYFKHRSRTLEIRIMPYADDEHEYIDMLFFNIETIDRIVEKYKDSFRKTFEIRLPRLSSTDAAEVVIL
jgi:hypothetical protein